MQLKAHETILDHFTQTLKPSHMKARSIVSEVCLFEDLSLLVYEKYKWIKGWFLLICNLTCAYFVELRLKQEVASQI